MASISGEDPPAPENPIRKVWTPRHYALSVLVVLVAGLLISWIVYNPHARTAQVEKARRLLQLNRPQPAVEALAKDDSAEGHYLKSIALQALGERKAAREQIEESLAIAADDPKYKGYQALLELLAGKNDSAQRLIEMYELYPSSPAVAFFATRGFIAKGNIDGAVKSFKLGLKLVDEVPEFMFQILQQAVLTDQSAAAEQLLKKLEQAAPNDGDFLRELLRVALRGKLVQPSEHLMQRIEVLTPNAPDLPELQVRMELLLGRPEAALLAARKALRTATNEAVVDGLLSEALLEASPKPEHERELATLAAKYPENPEFVARQAKYLTNQNRLPEAVDQVNQVITKTKSPAVRAALLNVVIRLPIEAGSTEIAQQQLDLHQSKFTYPLGVEYFKGRILYVKRDYKGALTHFQKVIDARESTTEAGRALAGECLVWQRRILSSQAVDERLKLAEEEMKKLTEKKKPAVKKGD